MKIVVIGGTGLIGSKVVALLTKSGHQAVAASPRLGINTLTGEGLAEALAGASVVVDVSNAPSFEETAVLAFFETSTRNLLGAEAASGVGHHVALSIVGIDRSPDNGYFKAKIAQEQLIASGPIPYSIVRATQFLEFIDGIADAATTGTEVHIPPVAFQPIAADDVARGRRGRGERPAKWPAGNRRSRAAPVRRRHPPSSAGAKRCASGDRRSARAVLRCRSERAVAHPAQRRTARQDPVRRLAHSRPDGSVATRRRLHGSQDRRWDIAAALASAASQGNSLLRRSMRSMDYSALSALTGRTRAASTSVKGTTYDVGG